MVRREPSPSTSMAPPSKTKGAKMVGMLRVSATSGASFLSRSYSL